MAFNPDEHIIKLKGKDYLEVAWRLVWFRDTYPKGMINSDVTILTEKTAIVKASVHDEQGDLMATGIATVRAADNSAWSGREFEKAETAAIGRALGHAGFGTQFTGDVEDDYLSDSPIAKNGKRQFAEGAWKQELMKLTAPLYEHEAHQKNSLTKAIDEKTIICSLDMSPLQATSIMVQRKLTAMYGVGDADIFNMLNKTLLEALGNTSIVDILAEAKLTFILEEVQ